MANYRKRSHASPVLVALAICVLGAIIVQSSFSQMHKYTSVLCIGAALIVVLFVVFALAVAQWRERRLRALQLIDIDAMDGFAFEHYLSQILKSRGFTNVSVTVAQGDYGADIIGNKDGKKYAIQAKRWKWVVGVEAIYQCLGGREYYGCDCCIVITNSTFTDQAKALAKKSGTYLIDRNILADWIIAFQKKK